MTQREAHSDPLSAGTQAAAALVASEKTLYVAYARCLYLWIDYPSFDKEVQIVRRKVPGIDERLAREIARFMETLRQVRLAKVPGIAETLDWAQALVALHADHLDEPLVAETLGCLLKDADDMKRFRAEVAKAGLTPFLPPQG